MEAQMGGAFFRPWEASVKPSLSWDDQVELMAGRGLLIGDRSACARFLAGNNYYRFSGYARYFQRAPHEGDDRFRAGVSFDEIRAVYDADKQVRAYLATSLASAEILLRAHVAYAIAQEYGPYQCYLEPDFYIEAGDHGMCVEACLRDIERCRDRHILHYRTEDGQAKDFGRLPIWSAVEAWSFGTLSRCIERGACGELARLVPQSMGIAKAGFAYRVRSLVYLRNRVAHQARLWHHSLVDSGQTPNNVRKKAKKLAGQFEPRSVLDVIASMDDILVRGAGVDRVLPTLVQEYADNTTFWEGLARPRSPRDHISTY